MSDEIPEETAASLMRAAREAARRAYVPYSRFPVGAALLTEDGAIFTGCNIENASYGLTVCAERVAIFTAAAAGHRVVRAIAVSAPRATTVSPCGACRQVLNEFVPTAGDLIVLMDTAEGVVHQTLDSLLPHSFGPRDLAGVSPADAAPHPTEPPRP